MRRVASAARSRAAAVRDRWRRPNRGPERGFGRLEPALVLILIVWSAVPGLWFERERPGLPAVDLGLAVFGAAQAAPLLWRRRAPEVALLVSGLAVGAGMLLIHPRILPGSLATLVAAYSVPVYSPRPQRPWAGWGAWIIAAVALLAFSAYLGGGQRVPPDSLSLLWLAGAWAGGRVRRQYLDLLDRERQQHTRQALAAERTRIARELHDLLAHSMSSMVVLAGVAQRVASSRPERAQELLAAIESTGREGLEETRRLLGVLRSRGEDTADQERAEAGTLAPVPSLRRLDELVDPARSAGLDVRVAVEGEPVALPAVVELSAYRIVQEALTNILRHAAAARAWLTLRYGDGVLEVEVVDDGIAPEPEHRGAERDAAGGYGLVGMRERAATVGGSLEAGPRAAGGWRVVARLPRVTSGGRSDPGRSAL